MNNFSYKQITSALCAIALCTSLAIIPAHAEDGSSSGRPAKSPRPLKTLSPEKINKAASKAAEIKNKIASKEAELASKAAQRFEDRCQKLNQKTTQILTRYESNRTKHIENYMQVQKRLEQVIAKLKAQGTDVSKLEADLAQLKTLIQKAKDDYLAFTTALKGTKNFACGKSEGAYANALKSSQTELMAARQSLLAVRTFYQTTIRVDIQALKSKKSSGAPKASGSANPVATASPTVTASPVATAVASPNAQ